MKLKTELPAYVRGKFVGNYTAELFKNNTGKTGVRIIPCQGTAGAWTYYLETLFQIDQWASHLPSDGLCIDMGQEWVVQNMLELYREILNDHIGI